MKDYINTVLFLGASNRHYSFTVELFETSHDDLDIKYPYRIRLTGNYTDEVMPTILMFKDVRKAHNKFKELTE